MELNKIYCTDVLDGLRGLDNESVDVIITSPPYNKRGLNKGINNPKSKWVCTIDYNGDANVDNLPEEEYEKWQIEILKECYRVLNQMFLYIICLKKQLISNGNIVMMIGIQIVGVIVLDLK